MTRKIILTFFEGFLSYLVMNCQNVTSYDEAFLLSLLYGSLASGFCTIFNYIIDKSKNINFKNDNSKGDDYFG